MANAQATAQGLGLTIEAYDSISMSEYEAYRFEHIAMFSYLDDEQLADESPPLEAFVGEATPIEMNAIVLTCTLNLTARYQLPGR